MTWHPQIPGDFYFYDGPHQEDYLASMMPMFQQGGTPKQIGVVRPITSNTLAHFMQLIGQAQRLNVPSIDIVISCDGGSIEPAFAMREVMRGTEGIVFSTHNIYATDSSAIVLYLGASRRIVSPGAAFLLHGITHNMGNKSGHEVVIRSTQLSELYADHQRKHEQLREAFVEGGIPDKDIDRYMTFGHSLSAKEALSIGFATHMDVYRLPKGVENITLVA